MTETEVLKWLWLNLPNLAIAIGVAKIYMKIASCVQRIDNQIAKNTKNIEHIFEMHLTRHPDDAVKILERRKQDEKA
jgi:hypothetical protein